MRRHARGWWLRNVRLEMGRPLIFLRTELAMNCKKACETCRLSTTSSLASCGATSTSTIASGLEESSCEATVRFRTHVAVRTTHPRSRSVYAFMLCECASGIVRTVANRRTRYCIAFTHGLDGQKESREAGYFSPVTCDRTVLATPLSRFDDRSRGVT